MGKGNAFKPVLNAVFWGGKIVDWTWKWIANFNTFQPSIKPTFKLRNQLKKNKIKNALTKNKKPPTFLAQKKYKNRPRFFH
jgi:hypothetical protein